MPEELKWLILFLIILLPVVVLLSPVSIRLQYFREDKDEIALLQIDGWGFSYTYRASPDLWLDLRKGKNKRTGSEDKDTGEGNSLCEDRKRKKSMGWSWREIQSAGFYILKAGKLFLTGARWENAEIIVNYGSGDAATTALVIGMARTLASNLQARLERGILGEMKAGGEDIVMEFFPNYRRDKLEARCNLELKTRIYRAGCALLYLLYHLKVKRRRGNG